MNFGHGPPRVSVRHGTLLDMFFYYSFQGGFGGSGPSQDQVYEAMEIFGEGIQDFDFNANADDDDAEVRRIGFFCWCLGLGEFRGGALTAVVCRHTGSMKLTA